MSERAPVLIQDVKNMNETEFIGWSLIVFGIVYVVFNILYPIGSV